MHRVLPFSFALCFGLAASSGVRAEEDYHSPKRLSLSSDESRLAVGGDDNSIRIWETATGKPIKKLAADQAVQAVAFADGRRLLFAGDAGTRNDASKPFISTLYAWKTDGEEFNLLWKTSLVGSIESVVVHPTNRWVVAVTRYGYIYFLDAENGKLRRAWQEMGNGIRDVAFTPDGRTLATAGQGFSVWDLTVEALSHEVEVETSVSETARNGIEKRFLRFRLANSSCVVSSPNGEWFAALGAFKNRRGYDSDLALIDSKSKRINKIVTEEAADSQCLAISRDGSLLAVGFDNGGVELWSPTGEKRDSIKPDVGKVRSLAFFNDGKRIAIAGEHGSRVEIREITTGKRLREFSVRD